MRTWARTLTQTRGSWSGMMEKGNNIIPYKCNSECTKCCCVEIVFHFCRINNSNSTHIYASHLAFFRAAWLAHLKSKVYTHHNSLHIFYVCSMVMRLIWAYGRFFVLINSQIEKYRVHTHARLSRKVTRYNVCLVCTHDVCDRLCYRNKETRAAFLPYSF